MEGDKGSGEGMKQKHVDLQAKENDTGESNEDSYDGDDTDIEEAEEQKTLQDLPLQQELHNWKEEWSLQKSRKKKGTRELKSLMKDKWREERSSSRKWGAPLIRHD